LTDLLCERLTRRQWAVTVEVVTPAVGDEHTRARILALAAAMRDDERIAALALTDRTTGAPTDDVVHLGALVAAASLAVPLVHVAGKGRTPQDLDTLLRRLRDAGLTSVLLTGGDVRSEDVGSDRVPSEAPGRTGAPAAPYDAVSMLADAARIVPGFLLCGVLEPLPGRALQESYDRAVSKRTVAVRAGAAWPPLALVAQVTWALALRETIAGWQAPLDVPILGAVMWLTRQRLQFLREHRIGGIVVPPALRSRLNGESPEDAQRRLTLDLVALRRLGYAGAHISGLLTPSRITAVLDESDRLDASLGDDWRVVSQRERGAR
jgi:5,10-methylenetetrahydrofolate reductase